MPEEEKKKEETEAEKGVIKHRFEVSTSEREKELQKSKEVLIKEKATLEAKFEEIQRKYNEGAEELKKATEDLKLTAEQRDDLAQKWSALSIKKFEEERKVLIDKAKEAINNEELIKEIEDKVKTPEDLDMWRFSLETLLKQIEERQKSVKAKEKEGVEPTGPPATPENKGSGGEGSATLESNSTNAEEDDLMKRKFKNPKELVDYLYDRIARGKTVTREVLQGGKKTIVEERIGPDLEAEQIINELWKKYALDERASAAGKRTYVTCWQCQGMYDIAQGTCPICKISLVEGPKTDKHGIRGS